MDALPTLWKDTNGRTRNALVRADVCSTLKVYSFQVRGKAFFPNYRPGVNRVGLLLLRLPQSSKYSSCSP